MIVKVYCLFVILCAFSCLILTTTLEVECNYLEVWELGHGVPWKNLLLSGQTSYCACGACPPPKSSLSYTHSYKDICSHREEIRVKPIAFPNEDQITMQMTDGSLLSLFISYIFDQYLPFFLASPSSLTGIRADPLDHISSFFSPLFLRVPSSKLP